MSKRPDVNQVAARIVAEATSEGERTQARPLTHAANLAPESPSEAESPTSDDTT